MNLQSIAISQLSAIFVIVVSYSSQCKRLYSTLIFGLQINSPKISLQKQFLYSSATEGLEILKKQLKRKKLVKWKISISRNFFFFFLSTIANIIFCLFTFFQDHNNIAMAEPSTSDAVVQEPTKKSQDYEDLFPKLPGAAPTSISGNNNSH